MDDVNDTTNHGDNTTTNIERDINQVETEEEEIARNLDTLITQYDVPELNEKLILALGEGRRLENILFEKEAEALRLP